MAAERPDYSIPEGERLQRVWTVLYDRWKAAHQAARSGRAD